MKHIQRYLIKTTNFIEIIIKIENIHLSTRETQQDNNK